MIDIKALNPSSPRKIDPESAYRAALTDPPASRLPAVLAVALGAVAVYLRSLFPDAAASAKEPVAEPAADEAITPASDDLPPAARQAAEADPIEPPTPEAAATADPPPVSGFDAGNVVMFPGPRAGATGGSPTPATPVSPRPEASASFTASGRDPSAEPASGGGAGGGARVSPASPGARMSDDESKSGEDLPDAASRNRAPRISGPLILPDLIACHMTFIALASLLVGAADDDGDTLAVEGLTASSGLLTPTEGGWMFQPAEDASGPVAFSYIITDGQASVAQTASFSTLEFNPVPGTQGDDILVGTMCADAIEALSGDDLIDARAGHDRVSGGPGDDLIVGGSGNDTIDAGEGHDVVHAGSGHDLVSGGSGNDRLHGEDGNDSLHGDAGHDLLDGGDGEDHLDGGSGDDTLAAGAGDDTLLGGLGDDHLDAGEGDNLVLTGSGSNRVHAGSGADIVIAESGSDHLVTGAGNDLVSGGSGDDMVDAGAGADRLFGEAGNDLLSAGSGSDTLLGGVGADTLEGGEGRDEVHGEDGDDVVVVTLDAEIDIYDGGAGDDALDVSDAAAAVVIDLIAGTLERQDAAPDLISGFEIILGGDHDDRFIVGTDGATLAGGAGDDTFSFRFDDAEQERELIHRILDLEPGDRIEIRNIQLFQTTDDADGDEDGDEVYPDGEDAPAPPFTFRIERVDDGNRTYIDVDLDENDDALIQIEIDGIHRFSYA